MRDLVILFVHIIATLARLLGPGGIRSIVAESVLVKQQLLILNRSRQRAPNLRSSDRLVAGLCALLIRLARLIHSAIVLKPSTLLNLHRILRNRKYRLLFSSKRRRKPGPKGPSRELIEAVVQTKRRNPAWGCPRIAQQIALAFNIPINKDIVRRILASHYRPERGPSWLTFIGSKASVLCTKQLSGSRCPVQEGVCIENGASHNSCELAFNLPFCIRTLSFPIPTQIIFHFWAHYGIKWKKRQTSQLRSGFWSPAGPAGAGGCADGGPAAVRTCQRWTMGRIGSQGSQSG